MFTQRVTLYYDLHKIITLVIRKVYKMTMCEICREFLPDATYMDSEQALCDNTRMKMFPYLTQSHCQQRIFIMFTMREISYFYHIYIKRSRLVDHLKTGPVFK
jgi:hypothetical protein